MTLSLLKCKHEEQILEYQRTVDKLAKEKSEQSEKNFAETRKLTQDLFQKTTELQINQKKVLTN